MTDSEFGFGRRVSRAPDDRMMAEPQFRRFKRANRKVSEPVVDNVPEELADDTSFEVSAEDWMDEVRAQTSAAIGGGSVRKAKPAQPKQVSAPRTPAPRKRAPMSLDHPIYVPDSELYGHGAFEEPAIEDIRREPTRRAAPAGRLPDPVHRATDTDIWQSLPLARSDLGPELLGDAVGVVSSLRHDPAARAFDLLRTRLVQTLKSNGWKNVAIASPTPGCGSTFSAVNLALSLSRVPHSRTVLMDLDLANPEISSLIGVGGTADAHYFLRGRIAPQDYFLRLSDRLAVGVSQHVYPDSSDLLHNPICAQALERMHDDLSPDVVIYDLPPILAQDDLAAFLPHVDGVLLVADGTKTTARHISDCERILRGHTELLGVVLNKARKSEVKVSAA